MRAFGLESFTFDVLTLISAKNEYLCILIRVFVFGV